MHSIVISAGALALDTVIKKKREKNKQIKEYLDGNIRIMTYHNYGAFLNCGDKKPFVVKVISVLLVFILTFVYVMTFTKFGSKQLRMGLALVLGGAYSNTYDRVKRGYVVDYLNFPKIPFKIRNIVFNISDFFIIIGACLIVIKQK